MNNDDTRDQVVSDLVKMARRGKVAFESIFDEYVMVMYYEQLQIWRGKGDRARLVLTNTAMLQLLRDVATRLGEPEVALQIEFELSEKIAVASPVLPVAFPREVVALPRSKTFITPEQVQRAKAAGMGRSRPLIHDIERAIRYAKRNKLFTADSIVEHREKRKLTLIVEADLSEFVSRCAQRRWNEEGD